MITRAYEKYIRVAPKKMAPMARLIRKKKVDKAMYLLLNTNKKSAAILRKTLESALNNAKRIPEKKFAEEDLFISRVIINSGPSLKRFRAMSMGRAGMIRKRMSHVLVELDAPERKVEPSGKTKKVFKKNFKPVRSKK